MDIFKKPVVIIIVIVAIVIALIWSYVSKTINNRKAEQEAATASQSTNSLTDLTNVDPSEYDSIIKSEYATAKSKAEENDPDNKLSAIEVVLPSLELRNGETRYVFSSDKDTDNNWTITFSQNSGNFLRADIPKNDYMGSLNPIDTSLWKINHVTALQIAEKNGGNDWRNDNTFSSINITLTQPTAGNSLSWMVVYNAPTGNFIKNIDAATGKLVE